MPFQCKTLKDALLWAFIHELDFSDRLDLGEMKQMAQVAFETSTQWTEMQRTNERFVMKQDMNIEAIKEVAKPGKITETDEGYLRYDIS